MIHNISPVNLKRPELDGDKEVSIGIKPYLYAGFAIRCALIIYGDYHDRSSDVKFTGIKINTSNLCNLSIHTEFPVKIFHTKKKVFLYEKDDF